jgi:hypothetical protein
MVISYLNPSRSSTQCRNSAVVLGFLVGVRLFPGRLKREKRRPRVHSNPVAFLFARKRHTTFTGHGDNRNPAAFFICRSQP